MEDLFRFILARPAQRVDAEKGVVPVQPSEDYHKRLKEAKASSDPISSMRRVALAYAISPQSLKSVTQLKYGAPLMEFFTALGAGADKPLNELAALATKLLGVAPKDLVALWEFRRGREQLSDVLVTNALLGRDGAVSSDDAARLLRAVAIIERVASGDKQLEAKDAIADALSRVLLLPADLFPIKASSAQGDVPAAEPPSDDKGLRDAALRAERERVLSTYTVLTRIAPEHLAVSTEEAHAEPKAEGPQGIGLPPLIPAAAEAGAREIQRVQVLGGSSLALRTAGTPMLLKPEVIAAFGEREKSVLAERSIDLTRVSLTSAVGRLSMELQGIELALAESEAATHKNMIRMGSYYTDDHAALVGPLVSGSVSSALVTIPTTHGSVAPAGIGDLLVVKQFLKRYEARELAHIENVLKGEYKERVHSRSRTTEETITVETEVKKEEERDQQTTERFELKTESSTVQKEDASLKIGLAVSGKYGPVVEFKASTDFALNASKEEASKVATSYSKDVTTRATSRIFERRREERILKTIEVFEEKNTHGIDNKAGNDHVIGQYQWIDKIYEAQVFNYGKRLLFDIMLPEPAAFWIYASGNQPKAGTDLVKPLPFALKPTDLTEWNYAYYVKQYEALGVEPPPEPYITVSKVLEGEGNNKDDGVATKTLEAPIKGGYQAIAGNVLCTFTLWGDDVGIDVVVGKQGNRFTKTNGWSWSFSMSNEVDSAPVTVKTFHADVFAVAIEINCQRSNRALDEWKLKTHATILQAYQKQLRDYEERLAALEVQAAQQIQGRNPLENEQLIRTELKKGAISVFTDQQYDLFGAIVLSPQGYPQPNLPEAAAEGKYIRFFEQAFEWEQMMFFYYPYFWGRKPNWLKRALLQDVDPLFAEFIKAGSARLVVSVRPGFEKAIAHFFDTGEIWDGGDLPDITSPLYVSIIEEIRERDKAPGAEVAQGDPWDVRLPTTLIKIRDKATLPEWQKNAQGEWVPV